MTVTAFLIIYMAAMFIGISLILGATGLFGLWETRVRRRRHKKLEKI